MFEVFMAILALGVSLLLASSYIKNKRFVYITKREARFGSIDGIRGFLALMVFFHHFVITWSWKSTGEWVRPENPLFQNFGKVGVAIFFMITGFLFISRILDRSYKIYWLRFFESRLFRIYPLYIFLLLIVTVIVFTETGFQLQVTKGQLLSQYLEVAK